MAAPALAPPRTSAAAPTRAGLERWTTADEAARPKRVAALRLFASTSYFKGMVGDGAATQSTL